QVYSRGMGPYFLTGTDHQAVVRGRAPRHRGVLIGRVTRVAGDSIYVEPAAAHAIAPLKPGDGVVFDAADWRSPEEPEEGGRVFEVRAAGRMFEMRFGNSAVDSRRIRSGDLVWRTHDPDVDRAARPYVEATVAVERLQDGQGRAPIQGTGSSPVTAQKTPGRRPAAGQKAWPHEEATMHLLVRTAEQLGAAVESRPATITLDYLDLYGLRPSLE